MNLAIFNRIFADTMIDLHINRKSNCFQTQRSFEKKLAWHKNPTDSNAPKEWNPTDVYTRRRETGHEFTKSISNNAFNIFHLF